LSEAGDKANQDASLEGHGEKNDEDQPETDPDPARQVLHPVGFTELRTQQGGFTEQSRANGCLTLNL